MSQSVSGHINIKGKRLETGFWGAPATPRGTILLLHEALGSVAYWKDFPEKLAQGTSCNVVAYSRAGHGESEGPVEPRSVEYYQNEVESVLPALISHFGIEQPVLYGHSEGAAIAFIYAAHHRSVRAIIAECPILVQEERTVKTIRDLEASYPTSDMKMRLSRYHRDADAVFQAWMSSNRSSFFRDYPLQQYLLQLTCPVLMLQGSRDEFGGARQFEALRHSVPTAQYVLLDAGHLLHREHPDLVVEHVQTFLSTVPPAASGANTLKE